MTTSGARVNVPESTIRSLLLDGVTAITANPAILDDVLSGLSADDLAACKGVWATNPLTVVSGFARSEGPYPVLAVTLSAETIMQDYVGHGEEAYIDTLGSGLRDGRAFKRRIQGIYGLHLYAEHPDVCSWYYRIVRRILNVGAGRLISAGLQDPTMQGAELMPDPRYSPDQLFMRRVNLTVEYEEVWTDRDSLAVALSLTESALSATGSLMVRHEDAAGEVTPRY
tara:strand:+ start:791 stop:1468 length:678 start_codon:yes stop_codon:yes gene_type:complete